MPATAAAQKEQPATRFAKDQLKAFVERIERLEEEKKATSDDIRDVYAEAKGTGYDIKALRTIVSLRKQDTDERREQQAVLETYMHALGCCRLFVVPGDPDLMGDPGPCPTIERARLVSAVAGTTAAITAATPSAC